MEDIESIAGITWMRTTPDREEWRKFEKACVYNHSQSFPTYEI